MRQHQPGDTQFPRAHELAAYLDGELDAAGHGQVARWLAEHPEAAAEIDAHRSLSRIWQSSRPTDPAPQCWAAVLANVHHGVYGIRSVRSTKGWRLMAFIGTVGGLAAALLLASFLPRSRTSSDPELTNVVVPFTVASPEDVQIRGLHFKDRITLVVGVPPVHGSLPLVSPDEVKIESVTPDTDGMVPLLSFDKESAAPMMVAPLRSGRPRVP